MSGKINETIDAHEVNIVKYNLFVALSNAEPFFLSVVLLLLERWAISTDWLSIRYYADAFGYSMAMFWATVFHLRNFSDLCIRNTIGN